MKIQVHKDGIVNIDCRNFNYANIRNMYTENRNGAGIQISDELKNKLDDVNDFCDAISEYIYKLQDLVAASKSVSVQRQSPQQNNPDGF
jgi:hypothetical protein